MTIARPFDLSHSVGGKAAASPLQLRLRTYVQVSLHTAQAFQHHTQMRLASASKRLRIALPRFLHLRQRAHTPQTALSHASLYELFQQLCGWETGRNSARFRAE
jgi:hypothetical protein